MQKEYIKVGILDKEKIAKYNDKLITDEVILTRERLNGHILIYHQNEYEQLKHYLKEIVEDPDIILEDNANIDTLIFLKHIQKIQKKARIVIKLATDKKEQVYTKNSIITIMRQREKSWQQTLKNKGKIIFEKTRQKRIKGV